MNVSDFLNIGIIGIIASFVVEMITRYSASKPLTSKLIAIGVSLVLGLAYFFASQTAWWTDVLSVLGVASTVYAIFFNKNTNTPVLSTM